MANIGKNWRSVTYTYDGEGLDIYDPGTEIRVEPERVIFPRTPSKRLPAAQEKRVIAIVDDAYSQGRDLQANDIAAEVYYAVNSSSTNLGSGGDRMVPANELFPDNELLSIAIEKNEQIPRYLPEEVQFIAQTPINLFLSWSSDARPRMKYRGIDAVRGVVHWGQRKLMLAEVLFLSECLASGFKGRRVVYIGAANGEHIPFLSILFPSLSFELWDPAEFHPKLIEYQRSYPNRIKMIREYFLPKDINELASASKAGEDFLFISDIRRRTLTTGTAEETQAFFQGKEEDMKFQVDIIRQSLPWATSLKFSPSYEKGITRYPSGSIMYQAWPPNSSTETRLWCFREDNPGYKSESELNNTVYEDNFFFHNNVVRYATIPTPNLPGANIAGVKNTYDLWHEIQVWKMYLNNYLLTSSTFFTPSEYRLSSNNEAARYSLIARLVSQLTQRLDKTFLEQYAIKVKYSSRLRTQVGDD